jgi:4-alpha-glucanotransferase
LPEGFREVLEAHGVQGLRVLYFERAADQGFIAPMHWSRQAVAMTSTHDIPTIAGWWTEHDLDLRDSLGLVRDLQAERAARAVDRERLWSAMKASGAAAGQTPPRDAPELVVDAAVAHTALSACDLMLLPMEDAIGTVEQPNLPGTHDQHPNWRRRLPDRAEKLLSAPPTARRLAAIRAARGGA